MDLRPTEKALANRLRPDIGVGIASNTTPSLAHIVPVSMCVCVYIYIYICVQIDR